MNGTVTEDGDASGHVTLDGTEIITALIELALNTRSTNIGLAKVAELLKEGDSSARRASADRLLGESLERDDKIVAQLHELFEMIGLEPHSP